MPFDLNVSAAGFPGGGGGGGGMTPNNITVPAALFTEWDWDETDPAILWTTDSTASTQESLRTQISAAMQDQGTEMSPNFHRIRWTGGTITGNLDLTGVSAPLPGFLTTRILVYSTDWSIITGRIATGSAMSNVMFKGFEFRTLGGAGVGWIAPSGGNGRRMALAACQGGAAYASVTDYTQYPEVWTSSGGANWYVTTRNCTMDRMYQIIDAWPGYHSIKHNFVTGLLDDIIGQSTRNIAPRVSHAYLVGNVICDMADVPDIPGEPPHCDFFQHGTRDDGPQDRYITQVHGNLFIGNTWRQYPTMTAVPQREGDSIEHRIIAHDNVWLVTGTRGFRMVDRRVSLHRNFHAWPPLGGPVPTTVLWNTNGWNGGPYRQHYRSDFSLGTDLDIDIGLYWAGENAQNVAGWGSLPNPAQILNHTAGLGGPTSYDTLLPNMTGLTYDGATLIIDNGYGSVARNSQAMREWVSDTYMPAGGWSANGFNDPAGWFV